MANTLTLSSKLSPFPYAAVAIALYTAKADVVYDESSSGSVLDLAGSKITIEEDIVHALAKAGGLSEDSAKSASFFTIAKALTSLSAIPDIIAALNSLDDHLAYRTFLVGHSITGADWMVWGALKGNVKIVGIMKNNQHVHISRWSSFLESLDSTQAALSSLTAAKSSKARSTKIAASFALGLEGAKEGEVVTRFPPEPSGYLHIGHAKAAMLNQYFAEMYKGKLIIRFDDTNPSKETTEFEETILEDLRLMDIVGDVITHTSDHFETLYNYAIQLIKAGKAYTDDTEQAQMRDERMHGKPSAHRNDSVDDNLKHFAEMTTGTPEGLRWCLRAKISFDDLNKALRDPVIYRCNVTPHHRTGDKWKVYPTYDFACPVVDSIEGVTHALRTNEYRDRNPQYFWMIEAVGLRPVRIWDFSRLNFVYTLLSKRKLREFVEKGIVRGWDDPRFPTIRGIRRRGLTVQALKEFMLNQGPSQAVVSLEWDSIWSSNKKIIDPIAPRHCVVIEDKKVVVTIQGGPTDAYVKSVPKHKKNPEVGDKKTVYANQILVDQEDAQSFDDQEEITLMDWGNAIVRSKMIAPSGEVTAITMDLHLEGDFKKTKKKITWLAVSTSDHPLVPVTLLDYDYLITKKKLEEEDSLSDFTTPVTEYRQFAVADANVRDLKRGEFIQFERKGYYIFDGVSADGRHEFISIPDGRAANLASKATPSATKVVEDAPSTKMYRVDNIYGDKVETNADTKMYKMETIY